MYSDHRSDEMSVITSDKIWKLSIENYFQEFMEFFAPDISKDIDFSKGFESLSKELEEISLESEVKTEDAMN